jgi:hypothetical protein
MALCLSVKSIQNLLCALALFMQISVFLNFNSENVESFQIIGWEPRPLTLKKASSHQSGLVVDILSVRQDVLSQAFLLRPNQHCFIA